MRFPLFAALLVAGALAAAPAHALNERVWLQVTGGGATYGMDNLNQVLSDYNASIAGAAPAFPLVRNGLGLGVAAGAELPNRWTIGVGLDRLYAETKASDASGAERDQFTANAWRLFAEYALRPVPSSGLRFGVGIGLLGESGKITQSVPGLAPVDYKLSGSAPLYEAYLGGDLWVAPQFALTAAGGYRYARLPETMLERSAVFINDNGEALELDYSGPYFRFGVKLLGRSSAD